METSEESQFQQFDKKIIRRELLPIWIKIFCWIFMLMGVASIACLIYGALGNAVELSFYGLETSNPISILGILLIAIIIFKAYVAFLLWFEKDNAIRLGKIDAISGIVICIISMLIMPMIVKDSNFTIRLEIALLIPFYIKLNRIEYEWENEEEQ